MNSTENSNRDKVNSKKVKTYVSLDVHYHINNAEITYVHLTKTGQIINTCNINDLAAGLKEQKYSIPTEFLRNNVTEVNVTNLKLETL